MNKRILIVAPHHDDECIGCGGLAAKMKANDWEIHAIFVFAPLESSKSVILKRKKESAAAAALLGIKLHPDIDIPCRVHVDTEDIAWKLVLLFRKIQPNILLIPHAEERDPEHQAVHRAGIEASWLCSTPFHKHLGSPVPSPQVILGYEIWTPIKRPNLIIDISSYLDLKLASINCYDSQLKLTKLAHAAEGLAVYRGAMFGNCLAAEAFSVIKIHENIVLYEVTK